jgi:hypothetical protein
MNNVSSIEVGDNELRIFADDGETIYDLGSYSTKAKAMKVLDMIQESYTNEKVAQILSHGLRTTPTKEINEASRIIKNAIQSSTVFQIPEDSEVEALV